MQIKIEERNVITLIIFDTDRENMSDDEIKWLDELDPNASAKGTHSGVITYCVSISPEMHLVVSRYRRDEMSVALFFFLCGLADGTQTTLYQSNAFDIVGELYSKCLSNVLNRNRGNWTYFDDEEYRITFELDSRKMVIFFPDRLKGLLIGKDGSNVTSLREFLMPIAKDVRIAW